MGTFMPRKMDVDAREHCRKLLVLLRKARLLRHARVVEPNEVDLGRVKARVKVRVRATVRVKIRVKERVRNMDRARVKKRVRVRVRTTRRSP